jgi:histidyl-tRNA synthetase
MFGADGVYADVEILQIAIELLLAFDPPEESFRLMVNNRKLLDAFLTQTLGVEKQQKTQLLRLLDKWNKRTGEQLHESVTNLGFDAEQWKIIESFMNATSIGELAKAIPSLEDDPALQYTREVIEALQDRGYYNYVEFAPQIIRGFDYYDGIIFEVFDLHPQNTRAMFGGGRYNGLAHIFGREPYPCVGCAPGDETTYLFLESWNLFPDFSKEVFYFPLLDTAFRQDQSLISQKLRQRGKNIEMGLEVQKVSKAIESALKRGASSVVLYGENEVREGIVRLKNLKTRQEQSLALKDIDISFVK